MSKRFRPRLFNQTRDDRKLKPQPDSRHKPDRGTRQLLLLPSRRDDLPLKTETSLEVEKVAKKCRLRPQRLRDRRNHRSNPEWADTNNPEPHERSDPPPSLIHRRPQSGPLKSSGSEPQHVPLHRQGQKDQIKAAM